MTGPKNQTDIRQVTGKTYKNLMKWHSVLEDLALPQLQHRSQLWLGLSPWPGNFQMLCDRKIKKKKNPNAKMAYFGLITPGFLSFPLISGEKQFSNH